MTPLYTAHATAIGGRNGHVKTSDGLLDFDLSTPKEMGGPGNPRSTNPEQLFACGYSACFGGAVDLAARLKHIKIGGVSVTAHVTFNKGDATDFRLSVKLETKIEGASRADAQMLIDEADKLCPYSKALRNNVEVVRTLVD